MDQVLVGVGVAVMVVLGMLVSRLMRSGGGALREQVAAAADRYGHPNETLASTAVTLDVPARLEATAREGELTVWLEHAVDTTGGILSSPDWTLEVQLAIDGQTTPIALAYDGEDVRVTPRQLGVTGLPSAWPSGQKTRIATLPVRAPGTRLTIEARISSPQPLRAARFELSIAAGPAPR